MAETIKSSDLNKNKKTGTGFVNLQRVLQANQGSGLGQAVSGQTQQIAQNVGSQVQKAGEQFQNKTQQAFQPFAGGEQFAKQAIQAPTGVSENDVNRFRTIAQGQYTGPKQLENVDTLQSGVQGVQNLAKLGQSAGGRQALLGTLFNRPQYSTGQKRLDALLLQADPTQSKSLGDLQNTAARTNRLFLNTAGFASGEGALREQQAKELGQNATQQLSTERANRDKEQQQKLADIQKKELELQPQFEALQRGLASGVISEADAQRLGLGDYLTSDTPIYGLDLSKFLNTNITQMPTSVQDTMAQEDAMRLNALAKLAGQGPMYEDLSKLGKYKESSQSFDVDKFKTEREKQIAEAEKTRQDLQAARQFAALVSKESPSSIGQIKDVLSRASRAGDDTASALNDKITKISDRKLNQLSPNDQQRIVQIASSVERNNSGGASDIRSVDELYSKMDRDPSFADKVASAVLRTDSGYSLSQNLPGSTQNILKTLTGKLGGYGIDPNTLEVRKLRKVDKY